MPNIQVLDQVTIDKIAGGRGDRTPGIDCKRTGGKCN